ncbi:hypothetical protein SAMN04488028_1011013 [Reichenbachiella agariperforans]|uniref:DoxX-like family protein n=2 Tax=Reichenbachiellaceae TaxID=2762302 RepID=A0A1M6LLJ3_REIAG|nr:hypothetical protein SAMN04488028_1011013 [Reichenbachiella agariperforans]
MQMKSRKYMTGFLGVSMFMVGFLKFFNPFKGWYAVQISSSGFGDLSYAMGIFGELVVGVALLYVLLFPHRFKLKWYYAINLTASAMVVVMMAVGILVHLHPEVPADVLPLKIKPPFIPAFFLLLGVAHGVLIAKEAMVNKVLVAN